MQNAQSLRRDSKLLAIALASWFSAPFALANPAGPSVASGQATFSRQGSALTVTNSPGAIINWQAFSIDRGEITRFLQQSPQSAVLNRVIGQDPSQILGTLQSNGRVFLINPNGIVFGQGAQIDVAGLVASSLKLSDADFLAGRLKFADTAGAGAVINQGAITTPRGGQVYLVAPQVENSGIIVSPKGEVVLAAGKTVEIVDAASPNLRVEITAPDNQVVNLGQIIAQGARVTLAGSAIRQAGVISADSAVVGENGKIVLKATKQLTLEGGSRTTASGLSGGSVTAESDDTTIVAGTVEARGEAGAGGTVQVLGDKVGLIGSTAIDASGTSGGGTVLVGGDFQGTNRAVRNASATFFGSDAAISADAVQEGDGGRVIVWADGTTRAYGTISARGGAVAGDGGFVEVSGKRSLDYAARASIGAAHGRGGTMLLDPSAVSLVAPGGTLDGELNGSADPSILFADGGANTTLSVSRLTSGFSAGDTITLQATGNITFGQAVALQPGVNLGLAAGNQISITSPLDTSGGNLSLGAGAGSTLSASVTANVLTATGGLTLSGGTLTLGAASTADNFSHSGGTLAGAGTLNVTGNMSALGGVLSGGNLAVQGTTTVSGLLFINNGATFTNSGTLVLQNSIDTSAGSGALINNGLIRNPSNAIHGLQTTTFVSNNGTLRNEGTGGLWLNGAGSYTFNGTTTLEGYGIQLRNATAAFIFPDGSVVNRTAFANPNGAAYLDSPFSANVQVGNATFNLPVSWFGGTVYNVGAGKTMTLNGGGFGSDVRFTGAGPTSHVALAAGQTLATTGTAILSNLTFDNLGTVALADTFINNGAVFNNSGTVNAAGGFISTNAGAGTFNNNGMLKNSGNSNIGISPSVFVSNNGTLRNEGTGSLALNGTGSYTFNGTTTLEGYGTQLRSGAASFVFPDGAVVNRTAFANANGMANLDAPFSPNVSVGNATFNLPVTWFGGSNYNVGAGKTMTLNGGGFGSDLRLTGAGPTSHVALAAGQTLATTGTAILSNLTFDNLGTVALADTFLNNGTVFNNGGTVNAAAGFISTNAGAGTFNNNGMLKNSGNFNIGISPGVFVSNNGTLRNEGTGGLWLTGAGTFTFNGTTTLEGYGIQLRSGTFGFADGSVVNRTAFSNPNGAAYLDAPFSMLNFGDTTLNSYLGQFGGTVVNVGAGKMLTLNGGMSTGAINGAGLTSTVLVGSSLTVPAGGVTMNTLRFNTAGDLTIPAGETFTQNGGAFDWTGGALAGTGTLTVGGGATFNLVGGGARVLDGLTLNVSGLTLPGGSLTVQSGSLNAAGITSIAPGTLLDVTGGTFNAGGGTVNVNGTFRAGAGAISAGTMNVNAGGLLNGTGTVTGNVVNNGTVAPGSSPGILTVVGNYTQGAGGTLAVEIGGLVPGADYDRLDVAGMATLAGTLDVSRLGGFVPAAGDVFRVVTAGGGVAGTFPTVPPQGGYTPGVTYLPLAVDLGLAPIAAGGGSPSTPPGASVGLAGTSTLATGAQREVVVGLDLVLDRVNAPRNDGPSPGRVIAANPSRPPGSGIQISRGTNASPRELGERQHVEAPPTITDKVRRYQNEQENELEIVYREQDAVRDNQRAHSTSGMDRADAMGREASEANEAATELARRKGLSRMDAAIEGAKAAEATRKKIADQTLLDHMVVQGTVDATTIRNLKATDAIELWANLETDSQIAGLKGSKFVLQNMDPAQLDALKEQLRTGKANRSDVVKAILADGFEKEYGYSADTLYRNMAAEAKPANNGGTRPGRGAESGRPTSGSRSAGESKPASSGGTRPGQGGESARPASGSRSAGGPGQGSLRGDLRGDSKAGGESPAREAGTASSGTGGGIEPGGGGDGRRFTITATDVAHNEDGSTTISITITSRDGAREDRVVVVERDGSANVYDKNGENGEFLAWYPPGSNQVDGVVPGTTWGHDGDQSRVVLEDQDRTDKPGSPGSGAPEGAGNAPATEDEKDKNEENGQGGGNENNEANNESAECTGGTDCPATSEEQPAEEPAKEEEEPSDTGRPNPMNDGPVDSYRETMLDLVLNQGAGTRRQMRAVEGAAGGNATNPGDNPNDTGAGGTTSPNLDVRYIAVKSGGGVDGGREPQIPEIVSNANMTYIGIMIGGGVTDPPREGDPAAPPSTDPTGPIGGGPIGPVNPIATQDSTRSTAATVSVTASAVAVSVLVIESIQTVER